MDSHIDKDMEWDNGMSQKEKRMILVTLYFHLLILISVMDGNHICLCISHITGLHI